MRFQFCPRPRRQPRPRHHADFAKKAAQMDDLSIGLILHTASMLAAKLAAPPLLAALAAGLVISIFQAVTQINEATLVFLPKAAALFAVLMIFGGSMFMSLDNFTHYIFSQIILAGGT
jgi:flagellar biosynthetic protein FliQ